MVSYTDFTGFTYDGYTSRDLGITRVSDGSRYTEQLLPQMKDTTVDPTGVDGQLFFSTFYKSKQINLNLAFDTLTETQLRNLRKVFNGRQPHDLIFNERPYKIYNAKVTGTPEIKVICFDEYVKYAGTPYTLPVTDPIRASIPGDDGVRYPIVKSETPIRIYKGEGTIQLTAFTPFARTPENKKFLDQYTDNNKVEWAESSGMLESQTTGGVTYDTYDSTNSKIPVFNPGDLSTPFRLTFTSTAVGQIQIAFGRQSSLLADHQLIINATAANQEFQWDSKTGLIYYCNNSHVPTTLANGAIVSGETLFNIGPCSVSDNYRFTFTNTSAATIKYDYLYF